MNNLLRHGFEYLLIAIVLMAAIVGLSLVRDYTTRLGLITLLTLFYVIAGIWHHHEEKNLHFKQVLEHLAVGFLIFVVLAALYR